MKPASCSLRPMHLSSPRHHTPAQDAGKLAGLLPRLFLSQSHAAPKHRHKNGICITANIHTK